jgi:signal transduction histidine kinase/ActR/RegA family two-component response regulator
MAQTNSFTVIGTQSIVSSRLLVVGLLWAAVILGIDLLSPNAVASGVPYVSLVLFSLWLPQRWYILVAAIAGTCLTIVGYFISSVGLTSSVVFANRFIAIFAIWVTSLLCYIYKRDEEILEVRTKELEATNIKLQEANNGKSRFLSSMSHELRTPLNAVLGFADLLKGKFFGVLNDKQSDYVNQIEKSGKHLLELINELLDMAKIDSGTAELRLEEFDPREYLIGTVGLMQPLFGKKDIDVSVSQDPSLTLMTGDRRRCNQIMLNLLSNAAKYTPEKGKVEVGFSRHEGQVRFTISDTGVGIEPEEVEKIFSEFHQANRERDENMGGTGIGLALTRRLVEMHGGEIGVTSTLEKGSTFWFTLPLKSLLPNSSKIPESETALSAKRGTVKHLLVVEDNEVNLAMILDMLSVSVHKVTIARNGQEAIDLAVASEPDLIFMDLKMPGMDGLEATRRLRKISGFSDLPIIGLTASAGEDARQKCLQAGCTGYLSKPIQSKELFGTLSIYLSEDAGEKMVFQAVKKEPVT